jgi:hypothetical protein
MLLTSLNKLILNLRSHDYTRFKSLETHLKVLGRVSNKILAPLEMEVRKLLKYTLLIERESESVKSPLMHLHGKIKILMSSCFIDMGSIKYIRRQE